MCRIHDARRARGDGGGSRGRQLAAGSAGDDRSCYRRCEHVGFRTGSCLADGTRRRRGVTRAGVSNGSRTPDVRRFGWWSQTRRSAVLCQHPDPRARGSASAHGAPRGGKRARPAHGRDVFRAARRIRRRTPDGSSIVVRGAPAPRHLLIGDNVRAGTKRVRGSSPSSFRMRGGREPIGLHHQLNRTTVSVAYQSTGSSRPTITAFVWVYSRYPSRPVSRPMPLAFMPPHGKAGSMR